MEKWKSKILAALLCVGLLAGSLPVRAVEFDGLNLSDRRVEQMGQTATGDYAVDPETARNYLNAIVQREQEIADTAQAEKELYGEHSGNTQPMENWLIDLDGDGDGELYMFDSNRPASADLAAGVYYAGGAIRSAEGVLLSFGGGFDDGSSRPCTVLIDPPYVGVFYDVGASSLAWGKSDAELYRYENNQLISVKKWFFNYDELQMARISSDPPSQLTVSYTDDAGQVITHTGTLPELEELDLPTIDPLAQMIEGAKAYGADFTNPPISNSGQGYYSNFMPTEQVKATLQAIVDAEGRGEQLLNPGDPVFQDVADTVAAWDALFTNEPFDLSAGENPRTEWMFNWWADFGDGDDAYNSTVEPVVFQGDTAALTAFI